MAVKMLSFTEVALFKRGRSGRYQYCSYDIVFNCRFIKM